MAFGTLNPVPIQQFFDNNGDPLAGGTLHFFLAGTDTPSPAYADLYLLTPLANPIVLDAAGRAPEHYLDALTYKEVLKNSAGVTIWTADNIQTPGAVRSGRGTISVSGLQHDVPIPPGLIAFVDFRNSATLTIDGFSGGTTGQMLVLRAFGAGQVDLINGGIGSLPQNQLINFVATGPTSLTGVIGGTGGAGSAVYLKGEGAWLLISHEQGGWIRLPYVPENFTATAGTWTVEAGDVLQLDYLLNGTVVLVTVALQNTVISAAPTTIRVAGWPYTWRTGTGFLPTVMNAGLGFLPGLMTAAPNVSVIDFAKPDFSAMAAGGVNLYAQATLDVK